MKLYYSNLESVNFEENEIQKIGVLVSYYNLKKIEIPSWTDSYFLDSGAFSAWRKNEKINIDNYIKFIHENKDRIQIYAALDVIGNAAESYKNYKIMRKAGLNPLPAFHIGERKRYLHKYADKTDFIALGGIAKENKKNRLNFLNECFNDFPDSTKIGFHGFGIADEYILSNYPWRTADASSIHMQARYGGIRTPFNTWCKINPDINTRESMKQTENKMDILKNWVRSNGFDWEKARGKTSEGIKERCKISICHYEEVAKKTPEYFETRSEGLF